MSSLIKSRQRALAIANVDLNGGGLTASEYSARAAALRGAFYIDYDPDNANRENMSSLEVAAERGQLEAVEELLDLGVPCTARALYLAAKEGRSEVVGALADVANDVNESGGWAGSALCAAACSMVPSRSIKAVEVLLQKAPMSTGKEDSTGMPCRAPRQAVASGSSDC